MEVSVLLDLERYPHIDRTRTEGRRRSAMARRVAEYVRDEGSANCAALDEETLFTAMHTCAHRATAGGGRAARRDQRIVWTERWSRIRAYIVKRNLGLVYSTLARFSQTARGIDEDELRSEGLFALLRALERFDPGRGFRFSTYACTIIRRSLMNRIAAERDYRRRFPVHHEEAYERPPRSEEASELALERLQRVLKRNVGELTSRESRVLAERFPADHGPRPTFAQLAATIGVSKERVRQIQKSALDKLRGALEADPVLQ
ncbi:MAG: sigma-70 family RNA polymerase sigma factor [Planctomycetes bacterium]|nr:sigma-70 family RNA polymerase sigma factor [Planctomycetota bacterium]